MTNSDLRDVVIDFADIHYLSTYKSKPNWLYLHLTPNEWSNFSKDVFISCKAPELISYLLQIDWRKYPKILVLYGYDGDNWVIRSVVNWDYKE